MVDAEEVRLGAEGTKDDVAGSVDQLHSWPRDYRMMGVVRDLHIRFGLGET